MDNVFLGASFNLMCAPRAAIQTDPGLQRDFATVSARHAGDPVAMARIGRMYGLEG